MSVMKTSLMIFPCVLGSALHHIRVCPGLYFATKRIGPSWCTFFTLVTCYPLQFILSQNYLLPLISVLAENTLLKSLFLILSNVMINCNCFNDWDYSLLVPNEVSEPCLTLWIDHYLSIRNHMTISIYVAAIRMIMMPSCPYFIFIDTSISKHVDIFFDFGFRLRTSEV